MDQVFAKEDIMPEADCLRFYNRKLRADMWKREKKKAEVRDAAEAAYRAEKAAENRVSYMKDIEKFF